VKFHSKIWQRGVSLSGLIIILIILSIIAVLAMKVVPTIMEYQAIKNAVAAAQASGSTVREIQASFDRRAQVDYITSISGRDLEITREGNHLEVAFAYEKRIPLFGPVSLVINYADATSANGTSTPAEGAE
jgi:predicted lipid-binding transport protein (Tim44 family)